MFSRSLVFLFSFLFILILPITVQARIDECSHFKCDYDGNDDDYIVDLYDHNSNEDCDKDGIPNANDECMFHKGDELRDGCPDTDRDGIRDLIYRYETVSCGHGNGHASFNEAIAFELTVDKCKNTPGVGYDYSKRHHNNGYYGNVSIPDGNGCLDHLKGNISGK